jgi:hypothetical protein
MTLEQEGRSTSIGVSARVWMAARVYLLGFLLAAVWV